jgi:hypothetical protein
VRLSAGPFGITVVEAHRPVTGYALLPECFKPPVVVVGGSLVSAEQVRTMFSLPRQSLGEIIDWHGQATAPSTPAELRHEKEAAARHSQQPHGWTNAYQSVTGLRWRCCGNRFEDDHSPWCAASGFLDPLPPA